MGVALLVVLYVFLYAPIFYVIYTSFSADIVWPFPPAFSVSVLRGSVRQLALRRGSVQQPDAGSRQRGAVDAPRHRRRHRGSSLPSRRWRLALLLFLAPLFVADLLIGISTLAFNARVLDLPGNMYSAIAANAIPGIAFAFLIILSQLVRYDWAMDDAAMVFGAAPMRCFSGVTLPIIWPCLFGAFLISFILAFNNLEISFYNLGAIPTLPSVAWGSLRFGLGPELFALASLVNFVFAIFAVMYVLMQPHGAVRLSRALSPVSPPNPIWFIEESTNHKSACL